MPRSRWYHPELRSRTLPYEPNLLVSVFFQFYNDKRELPKTNSASDQDLESHEQRYAASNTVRQSWSSQYLYLPSECLPGGARDERHDLRGSQANNRKKRPVCRTQNSRRESTARVRFDRDLHNRDLHREPSGYELDFDRNEVIHS